MRHPSSSSISRASAATSLSPASRLPPGCMKTAVPRLRTSRTRPSLSRMRAATTLMIPSFMSVTARSSLAPRNILLHRRFPMPAVEIFRLDRREIDIVDAARIDVDLVRIGARHVERMDAANLAEGVLRDAGVEPVGREIVPAAEKLEALRRHDQMQDTLLGADRAVADRDAIEIGRHAEAHAAAVTSALHRLHRAVLRLLAARTMAQVNWIAMITGHRNQNQSQDAALALLTTRN